MNNNFANNNYPKKQGLYDPTFEHDSCGVGFVVNIKGNKQNQIIHNAIEILNNLTHRGAVGADPKTGDGSGIMIQIPHAFFKDALKDGNINLPLAGDYGVGVINLPQDKEQREKCGHVIESIIAEEEQIILGWRKVPINEAFVGVHAAEVMPRLRHLFIGKSDPSMSDEDFERKLFVIRKLIYSSLKVPLFSISSLSSRTIIYKGMLNPDQLQPFFEDLNHELVDSALALVHSRFSTNTFPSWNLAQPFRMVAHNGEINTLRGNINWMNARQHSLKSDLYDHLPKLFPLIVPHGSDSACFDNAFEFLVMSGYSPAQSMMMMVPEAWNNHPYMSDEKKAFYQFSEHKMEPWDGPAALAFTDGVQIGATLDRNGLRPARYVVTNDDMVIMASEVGALNIEPKKILKKGRLQPGKMFLVDTKEGRIIDDSEIKDVICKKFPYRDWLNSNMVKLDDLPTAKSNKKIEDLPKWQKLFGYSLEDLNMLLEPMFLEGKEATGSMGNDTPLAVLSKTPQVLYNYFKQLFAQVTNPAVDSIREELVMSLNSHLGAEGNILATDGEHAKMLTITHPVLSDDELLKIENINTNGLKAVKLSITFDKTKNNLEESLNELCVQAEQAINENAQILILSDREISETIVPIPALLATGAVHHYLIKKTLRTKVGLVIETGEAREIAHFALLIGYGAGAVNPYVAIETIDNMLENGNYKADINSEKAFENYKASIKKGLFKIFAKMGISTIQSYRGAQIFEAIGICSDLVDKYFSGTPSRIGGIDLEALSKEVTLRHNLAFENTLENEKDLSSGGAYFWRRRGEFHQINPLSVDLIQKAAFQNNQESYDAFSKLVNDPERLANLRDLLEFNTSGKSVKSIDISEVEPASEIVKRFATGAMSFGSISLETHETLAIAMNRIGGKSNSGEGGENPDRFKVRENGDLAISHIKQVASGRFGVTIHYLVNCVELQIKVAQGAKPGEGGQLPGKKVSKDIASVRNSTPGVTLISPPPHHDIYSIEDLAQLIFDLKNANPKARVTVKLVAEAGVGTIAAGVAKAHADMIVIAGHDGGTGASPLTSIKHTGIPWELGLSETHQSLLLNGLRNRVRLQTDGQLKTGRDVMVAALLGAEEFTFATMPLIAVGCIMMRKCHLNTCPVGIATQNPILRKKFKGQPENVINYLFFVAEELRGIMASLGLKTLNDAIGRSDLLKQRTDITHYKAKGVNLDMLLHCPDIAEGLALYCNEEQDHGISEQIDYGIIKQASEAISSKTKVDINMGIKNTDRTVGTLLSSEIAKKYGAEGLPDNTVTINFKGSAGQSFGAFLAKGVSLKLEGDANDYVGKGLSGGKISILPPKESAFKADENIIVGNTLLYGATSGEVFIRGVAGERFAVRNSGANAVIEGVGDHCCEYMTGGKVLVIGETGRNFAAGMSGGIAYVYDAKGDFNKKCNQGMVELEELVESDDIHWVKERLQLHITETGSEKAYTILNDFDSLKSCFVKVMPTEYKKVLADLAKESIKKSA